MRVDEDDFDLEPGAPLHLQVAEFPTAYAKPYTERT